MKVLLANKFYYRRGGDCVYTLQLQEMLEANGNSVAVFAMRHPQNLPSKWQKYFPSEVAFSPRKPLQFLKALARPFFSWEVWWKFGKLLKEFQPDVVHLNNIHTQLSPLIAKMAYDRGIRVVWTLHDYKLLCPRYDCLRYGKPCEQCYTDDKSFAWKYSCIKNSRSASLIGWLEAKLWNRCRLEKYVSAFICPSGFMKAKMIQGGFGCQKLNVRFNFLNEKFEQLSEVTTKGYYCYFGRLTEEKGIRTLLSVAAGLQVPLKVVGSGPLENTLRREYSHYSHIEFLGHCEWAQSREIIAAAICCVIPSEWYENNPLSLIESLMLGTPVLCSDIGGLTEMAQVSSQVLTFKSGDAVELKSALQSIFQNPPPRVIVDRQLFSGAAYWSDLQTIYNIRSVSSEAMD